MPLSSRRAANSAYTSSSDGTDSPYRMRYRPPALYALQAGEAMLPGLLIADAVVLMGSMDLVLGEVDR